MTWNFKYTWAAGFFDGEGCVSISKRKRGNFVEHFLSVQIGQGTRASLDEFAREFGGGVTRDRRPGGAFFRWRVHGLEAERFLKAISRHSLVKREEILAALQLRAAIGKPCLRSKPGAWEKKEAAYQRWRKARNDVALSRRGG